MFMRIRSGAVPNLRFPRTKSRADISRECGEPHGHAVKYEHQHGSTKIGFRGTDLMPGVSGEAKVESKRGTMQIKAEISGLEGPTTFGNEYLTYVLWAISPEGRARILARF